MLFNQTSFTKRPLLPVVVTAAALVFTQSSDAATIAADGGITLYISYDNADVPGGVSWNDNVTQVNSVSGVSCNPTNNARSNLGAPNSPGSCPGGNTCQGREKLVGDLDAFAEYIYQSTEGEHYLRRVYLSDNGRAWGQADIKWSVGGGGSTAPAAWQTPFSALNLRSATRRCIHDVLHHEFGHYFYNLPDRYARSTPYYYGSIGGGSAFDVDINVGDPNTVMSGNFPHFFVDTTNAQITVSYDPGGGLVSNEVLTPDLLADADPANDGPDRAHHGHTTPFAQDEWSLLPSRHADLAGVHTEGDFTVPDMTTMPEPEYIFLGEDEPHPGTVLLLDRSGSMGVTTNGVTAAQFVQEAGMFLYHSSLPGDYVGTQLYNASVETLFDYEEYDPSNNLPYANFRTASGLTNIATALESAIDALIAEHGEEGVSGGKIVLMSDGVQTTGPNLWDQVTRAEEKGIEIHTLSFGNADTATMEAIATTTGGDVIEMAEKTDGSELKLGMSRELSELRGLTPIHFQKGKLKPNADSEEGAVYEGTFTLPPNSRALQFYSFLEIGNAAEFGLELEDSAGNIYVANPKNVAHKGRLNGLTVPTPKGGKWLFRIKGSKRLKGNLPTNDRFELLAYTMDLNLDPTLDVVKAGPKYPGQFIIRGMLNHRYPLMNINAVADIYIGSNKLQTVQLFDNGKEHIDDVKNDGIHSALFNPASLYNFDSPLFNPSSFYNFNKVRIDVRFTTNKYSRPAESAHYETGTDLKLITDEYEKILKAGFSAFATDTVSLSDNSKYDPRIINIYPHAPVDLKPGARGQLRVTVENAYLNRSTLRAALGQGIRVEVVDVFQDKQYFRSYVTLAYEVLEDVNNGFRHLTLQVNALSFSEDDVVKISGGKYVGLGPVEIKPTKSNKLIFERIFEPKVVSPTYSKPAFLKLK